MAEDRVPHLISLLLDKTRDDALDWVKTQADDAFRTSVGNRPVVVSKERDASDSWNMLPGLHGKAALLLRLYDEKGTHMETIGEGDLKGMFYQGCDVADMLRELFDRARRRALGIDRVIDDVISDLEGSAG